MCAGIQQEKYIFKGEIKHSVGGLRVYSKLNAEVYVFGWYFYWVFCVFNNFVHVWVFKKRATLSENELSVWARKNWNHKLFSSVYRYPLHREQEIKVKSLFLRALFKNYIFSIKTSKLASKLFLFHVTYNWSILHFIKHKIP